MSKYYYDHNGVLRGPHGQRAYADGNGFIMPDSQVEMIRGIFAAIKAGETDTEISRRFPYTSNTIYNIRVGMSHRNITGLKMWDDTYKIPKKGPPCTSSDAWEIGQRLLDNELGSEIARDYPFSASIVYSIKRGDVFPEVTGFDEFTFDI